MGHYVYRYMHPDYPWLYVGKTDTSLETRIKTHDTDKNDNISREYLPLLKESVVLYIELQNSLQTTYIEKLLIDKYKPTLNKADKVEEECPIDFSIPKWKKYIRKSDVLDVSLFNQLKERLDIKNKPAIEETNNYQKEDEDDLNGQFCDLGLYEQHIFLYLCKVFVENHSFSYTFDINKFLEECYFKFDNQNSYNIVRNLLFNFYSRGVNIVLDGCSTYTHWIGKVYLNSEENTVTIGICEDIVPFMDRIWYDYDFVLPTYTEVNL